MSASGFGIADILTYAGRREGYKTFYAPNAGVKAWAKRTLNRKARRVANTHLDQPYSDSVYPPAEIPHASVKAGRVVASTNWKSFADSMIPQFLRDIEQAFTNLPDCSRFKYLDRLESNIKLNQQLRELAKASIPYAYGEIQNALKRGTK